MKEYLEGVTVNGNQITLHLHPKYKENPLRISGLLYGFHRRCRGAFCLEFKRPSQHARVVTLEIMPGFVGKYKSLEDVLGLFPTKLTPPKPYKIGVRRNDNYSFTVCQPTQTHIAPTPLVIAVPSMPLDYQPFITTAELERRQQLATLLEQYNQLSCLLARSYPEFVNPAPTTYPTPVIWHDQFSRVSTESNEGESFDSLLPEAGLSFGNGII